MNIRYLIMDVDGTLTDGCIYYSNSGEELKAFNIKDGYGIKMLLSSSKIKPVVVTGRNSQIVSKRCEELGITLVFQGVNEKLSVLKQLTSDFSQIAYIGDDENDLSSMNEVSKSGGIIGCPKDAVDSIKRMCSFISSFNGGNGAVREFIEWLLTKQ